MSDDVQVDPQRIIRKLRDELAEALFQKAAYAAFADQLLEGRQRYAQGEPDVPGAPSS